MSFFPMNLICPPPYACEEEKADLGGEAGSEGL